MIHKDQRLQAILDKVVDHKKVFGTSFCVKYQGNVWEGFSGNFNQQQPYFIASTTKLFVTALLLHFQAKGLISMDDRIEKYLDKEVLKDLHTLEGKDYGSQILVKNLLAHTSGIPDYFQQKQKNGMSLEKEITNGQDQHWTFDEAVLRSKQLKPLFVPNAPGKAFYSDTNFQLLGKIIERITNKCIAENLQEVIIQPLHLVDTYLFQDEKDGRPKAFYYKSKVLHVPKAMTSFGADGGMVSTSRELMIFLEAFFSGIFFPKSMVDDLKIWNSIFFPMKSGIGIHRFKLPWIFNPFGSIPELLGHSGLSGTLAFHNPEKELFITGTVNQVAFPDTSFRVAIQLIQKTLAK